MCFRCGSEDHFVANFPKPDASDKKIHWNTENLETRAYISNKMDKKSENSAYERESQKIYASIVRKSSNVEIHKKNRRQLATEQLDFKLRCDM